MQETRSIRDDREDPRMRQALEVIRLRLQQIWGYLTLHLFDEPV